MELDSKASCHQGQLLLRAGQWIKALSCFKHALQLNHLEEDAAKGMVRALGALGRDGEVSEWRAIQRTIHAAIEGEAFWAAFHANPNSSDGYQGDQLMSMSRSHHDLIRRLEEQLSSLLAKLEGR